MQVLLAKSLRFLPDASSRFVRFLFTPLLQLFAKDYWFSPGCQKSYQFSRYAFALLYLYLANLWIGYPTTLNIESSVSSLDPEAYRPLGILSLFGTTPPPMIFFKVCIQLLQICPIALFLGFFSRLSLAGCTVGLFGLAIYQYGYCAEWSHGFSPLLVSSLPFLLGPRHNSGFDGWFNKWRNRDWTRTEECRARVAVMSTQVMISLVFLNAAFFKFYAHGEGLNAFFPWVFSDNLRNIIIRQHVIFDAPLNGLFRYIVTHEFAFKGMAVGNILAQSLPFMALFFMRRPMLRFLCGVALGMEVIGLGVIMGIWNIHWLLFIAFFIDWDRLPFWRTAFPSEEPRRVVSGRFSCLANTVHCLTLISLFAFNCYVMGFHRYQRAWTFPFTSYPMFSTVTAEKPYDQHLPYTIPISRFEYKSDAPIPADLLHRLWLVNWGTMWLEEPKPANLGLLNNLNNELPSPVTEMKSYRALLRIEKYPSCQLNEVFRLPVFHYRGGQIKAVASKVRRDPDKKLYLEFELEGFQSPHVELKYFTEDGQGPFDLPGTLAKNRFYFDLAGAEKAIAVFEIQEPDAPPVLYCGARLSLS